MFQNTISKVENGTKTGTLEQTKTRLNPYISKTPNPKKIP
jgi:hypothetical protein